jgi:elongation factor P
VVAARIGRDEEGILLINVSELRKGVNIELDGQLMSVIEFEHIKMGRGGALVRLKVRNLRSGAIFERTFSASEKFRRIYMDHRKAQYSYSEDELYHFMDTETFEDIPVAGRTIGDDVKWLKENINVELLTYDNEVIAVELPISVEYTITQTDPGFKGDTASGGTKPAILETGAKVNVPLFVNQGDVIRVDTRDGSYLERA